jgi:uroporphyrinogen decarboxylase
VPRFDSLPRDQVPAALVAAMKANDGLAPVDIERFWEDDAKAQADPFGPDIPQVPLGIRMSWECVFDELGVPEDRVRYRDDPEWGLSLRVAYNDKAERIVGRRLLDESPPSDEPGYPPVKGLHDLFEARNEWRAGSWWLMQSAHGEDELAALLDRVERRNETLRDFLLPDGWGEAKERLMARGKTPPLYRGQRGPVTFAMSIYGVEDLIFLLHDRPHLAARFRNLILQTMLGIARVLDEEAGYTPQTAPRGFAFCDDNCALLTPDMYEFFGYPILKGVFDRYSPNPDDRRYQHSDSAMSHIIPILGRLDLTGTNFGPTVTVANIREHLPHAVIDGQLAPFTFSRNDEESMVAQFLRDFAQARESRGLRFATAGSINNGSRLTGMRLLMSAIQHCGRYEA